MDYLSQYLLISLRKRIPLVAIITELAHTITAFVTAHPEFEIRQYE